MGAFLSGLFDRIEQRAEKKHDEEEQRKKDRRGDLWKVIQSPDFSDESKQQAWTELQKISNPETKKGIGKLHQFFTQLKPITGAMAGQQQQQGGQPAQPSPNARLQPPAQQPPANYSPAPWSERAPGLPAFPGAPAATQPPQQQAPPAAPGPFLTHEQKTKQQIADDEADWNAWYERGKKVLGTDASPRDLAEYAGSRGQRLPTQPSPGTRKALTFKLPDGSKADVFQDSKSGAIFDANNQPFTVPEGAELVGKQSSARPTIIASDFVTMQDAKKLKDAGAPFLGQDGKELDLSKIPDGMVLQKVHYADGKTLYEPRNINDKVVRVGNVEYAVNPAQVQQLGKGAGTELGVVNPGATTKRETQAIDPVTGQPVAQTLTTTRTPITTGVQGTGAAPAQGATPAAPAQPHTSPISPSTGRPVGAPAATPQAGYRPLPGMTPGQFNRTLDRITPVRESATQIFGDPSQPEMKSMLTFADMADNPASREKIGKALNLTFDAMEKASGEAHVTAGVGPVGVHAGGGVIQLLENYFGVPAKLADQTNQIMQKAIADLSPEEREAYDATMSTYATMVGLRSLTKASAAQASVRSIEQEIPTIGRFTASKDQYLDRLQHVAEVIFNGSKGIPESMWNQTPELYKQIQDMPSRIQQMRKKPGQKLTPPGTLPKPKAKGETASDEVLRSYLAANGNDVTKTRKALTDAGYVIGK